MKQYHIPRIRKLSDEMKGGGKAWERMRLVYLLSLATLYRWSAEEATTMTIRDHILTKAKECEYHAAEIEKDI
jgi:hypothetical protein